MEFGIHLPHVGPFATPEAINGVARKAEELGYHSLWVSDHIITPRKIDSPYPGGRYRVQPDWPFLEPVSTLLFAAAVNKRVRLGTSVLVITQRQPVILAKQLATLDFLSNGRLIFGAGAGWIWADANLWGFSIYAPNQLDADFLDLDLDGNAD